MIVSEISLFIVFFGTFLTVSALDLCDKNAESNLTSYSDSKLQNCGCNAAFCIRKCCKPGYFLGKHRTCLKVTLYNETFELPVYKRKTTFSRVVSDVSNFAVGVLECHYYKLDNFNRNDSYFVQEDGSLWLPFIGNGVFYENSRYCVDELDGLSAVLCFPEEGAGEQIGRDVNIFGMIISMPFLLATFLVYAILPDRNVHQRALMFYVLTLCISYILLVTINLSTQIEPPWCEIFAYSTLFFFMVSFFWMNIICFDIWYTFSGGRGFVGSKRTSERRRFLCYSAYAWGVPLVHVGLVITMQKVLPENSVHNPGVGATKCFLADGWPNLWYFYGEAAILVIVNIVFFMCTALKIRQVKKETSMLKHSDSKRHAYEKDKQKFNLYLKLLFAMGVNWSMEVISWLVNWQTDNKSKEVWYVTDFFNAVYGVFIFFIFVFKKKIWKLLQKRYYVFVGKPHLAHTVTSTNTRTSHYSSTNYSTADTAITDRTNGTSGTRPEEMGLRRIT